MSLIGAVAVTSAFGGPLIVLVPFAVFGLYAAAGRVVHRRLRVRHCAYLLTGLQADHVMADRR